MLPARNTTMGDFVYTAVHLAFANPPPDVVAESRTAHAAATVEIVAAAGFLAAYLGAFLAGRRLTAGSRPPEGRPRWPATGRDRSFRGDCWRSYCRTHLRTALSETPYRRPTALQLDASISARSCASGGRSTTRRWGCGTATFEQA